MNFDSSFRFVDDALNRRLIAAIKRADAPYRIDAEGVIHFSSVDEQLIENELIRSLRDERFSSWQVMSCPPEWIDRYRTYMRRHNIPFEEEMIDGQLSFLISRKHRPHQWKLPPHKRSDESLVTLRRRTA